MMLYELVFFWYLDCARTRVL